MTIAKIIVWITAAVVVALIWTSRPEEKTAVKMLQTLVAVTVGFMVAKVTGIRVQK